MQTTIVRHARTGDIDWLATHDRWPRAEDWPLKVAARHIYLAEHAGERAGWARLDVLRSTVPFMAMIQVLPPWRGRSLSRALLDFIETDLRRRGYAALLSSAQSDEPQAQAWHLRLGFAHNGIVEHVVDEGIHELVYRKLLAAAPQ
ncbi:MAG: GNAT family N-acetyltransferase [Betaproteobacteria bacterium]